MGWSERRLQEYAQGKKANWLEKKVLEHANPINCVAHLVSTIALVYGLWIHNWSWIIAGIAIAFIGHLYVWLKK